LATGQRFLVQRLKYGANYAHHKMDQSHLEYYYLNVFEEQTQMKLSKE